MTNYKVLSAKKKAQQESKIPQEWRIDKDNFHDGLNVMSVPETCGVLSDLDTRITTVADATALAVEIRAGTWSVEQVTTAFCKRAAIAHQLTNCLTEIFFEEAIERARQLDKKYEELKAQSDPFPPFFGIPISLKDSFDVAGYDTSTGLGCYVDEPAKSNSPLAKMLLDLGAVLYCKTNLPQLIMTGDSENFIFGRTLNPRNKLLTAGGSTGGEGALLALRGSILGVGTDIGGSIRVPSVCNGLYGFRPSVGLIPHGGVRDLTPPGLPGVQSSVGPMAHSVRDCKLFLRTILEAETWKYDSTVLSVPWIGAKSKKRLRVGVAQDDGMYTPTPPVRRILAQAMNALSRDNDIEIVPITLPDVRNHYYDLVAYFTLAGGEYYHEQFARTGEPTIPSLEAVGLLSFPKAGLQDLQDLNVRRAEAAKTYQTLFLDNNLDAVMMPPAPHTAVAFNCWTTASYHGLWNYLDYPAMVIPVDQVSDTDLADDLTNAQFGAEDEKLYSLYTGPEQYRDAPLCVQVVGYRHKDEAFLNAARAIDAIIHEM